MLETNAEYVQSIYVKKYQGTLCEELYTNSYGKDIYIFPK